MTGKVALLLLVAIAAVSGKPATRIIGGQEANAHEFPFLVEIKRVGAHFCSGAILNDEWIVTAAHCATGRPADYSVVAGEHALNVTEGSEQVRQVVRVVSHPLYDSAGVADFENDIAVMQVLPPFQLNANVSVATFASAGFVPESFGTIAGWGSTAEQGAIADILRKADAPLVSDAECNTAYGGDAVVDSMVCAGGNGTDFCTGDSGGPLLCPGGNGSVLCGIMSWGLGCGRPGFPGVYTETSYFEDWLVNAILPEPEDNSTYVEQLEGCGGNLVGSNGKIGYQFNGAHGENERCTWSVRANFRETVRLTLNSSQGFGPGTYLEITEVDLDSARVSRRTVIDPENSISLVPGPMVLITLVSNTSSVGGEFILLFQGLGEQGTSENRLTHVHVGNLTSSYSYPASGQYGNDEVNTFLINPPTGAISLRFDRLDLEGGSCTYDVIHVHTHSASGFSTVASVCGTSAPSTTYVSDGVILLIMKTDFSVTATGFTVSWT